MNFLLLYRSPDHAKESHQKLSRFVSRLDMDFSKEAQFLKDSLGKAQQVVPIVTEDKKVKAKLSTPDGKVHEIPILTGTMGEQHLDIRALYAQTGMFLFDPGFTITGSCASQITYVNSGGKLLYRGYPVEDLIQNASYMEVCYIILYGELPSKSELTSFEEKM